MTMELLKGIFTGFLFGAGLYFVGATNKKQLILMLKLKDFSILKMILTAIGVAALLIHLSFHFGIMATSKLSIKTMYSGVVLGAGILGTGFGLIGLCPGTAVGALASGYKKAIIVILGGLVGAYTFAHTYASLKNLGLFEPLLGGKTTLFYVSDKITHIFNIGALGGVFVGIVFILIAFLLPENKRQ